MLLANDHTPQYCLNSEVIDIWLIPLTWQPEFQQIYSYLNEDELTRAKRFYFLKHQQRFALGRAMLKILLAAYLKENPKKLCFAYNSYGKPTIPDKGSSLEFNLTHSNDIALLAVGKKYPLGIDLEYFSERPYEGIAQHLFSEEECKQFLRLPSYLQPLSFFHLWTQKEAIVKACGLSLSLSAKKLTCPILPSQAKSTIYINNTLWQISSFTPKIATRAALCHYPNVRKINYFIMDATHLSECIWQQT